MRARQRRWSLRLVALAALALCICLAGAGSASAAGYKFKETFGASAQPSFGRATALTVDPAGGDLLVVDVHEVAPLEITGAIKRYSPDGTPANFSALGTNVIDGEGSGPPCVPPSVECDGTPQHKLNFGFGNPREVQVAVAPPGAAGGTAGDIYVTQPRNSFNLIDVFAPSGEYLGQLTASSEGPFGITPGVAVDPAGAVYVSDGSSQKIHKFLPTSNSPFAATNTANFVRTLPGPLAAGVGTTAGSVFSDRFGAEPVKLDATSGVQQCQISPEESITLAVNSANGHLLSASATEIKEYEGSCTTSPEVPVRNFAPGEGIRGVASDGPAGLVYVARAGLGTIEVWEVTKVPEAKTLPAGPVGVTGATLRGEVNPNGLPLTECAFEWGETTTYGHLAPCEAPDAAEVGEGTSFVPVHATTPSLEAGTAYHFQLVVANANNAPGEVIPGGDREFRTLGPQVRGTAASEVTATTARIGATIDPNGEETGFFVEYLSDAAFQANPETERFADATRAPLGERRVPVGVSGSGNVEIGSSIITGVRAGSGAFGPGETIAGPGIPANTTILSLPTPTQLQLSKPATQTTVAAALTATGPQPVSQLLTGLEPETTYHFRVVASNGAATTAAAAGALTTFALPGARGNCPNEALRLGLSAALPDCRAYEMISPPQKGGEVIAPEPSAQLGGSCGECLPAVNNRTLPMQSAPDGDTVLYSGQPFNGGLSALPNDYLSGRTAGGWSLQSQNPPSVTGFWQAFSADLSRGILAQAKPPLAPAAPIRAGRGFANLYLQVAGGAFEPLITEEPPVREPGDVGANQFRVRFAAANSGTIPAQAFTHVAFEANDGLTGAVAGVAPAAPSVGEAAHECSVDPCDLYEWSEGRLGLVNVLPGNAQAAGEAVIGSGQLLNGDPQNNAPDVDHAISADGSRVFWSTGEAGHVYARVDDARTLEVPGPATCKESVGQSSRACFLTASADGSRALLSNGQMDGLEKAGTGEEAYAQEVDLTAGKGGFQGILGAAEDFSRVYFVDREALTPPGEVNANPKGPEHAEEGAFNLYVWERGTTRFIGKLLGGDNGFGLGGRFGAWNASPSDRTAQVTADGSYLAFMSTARLTGYDNTCTHFNENTEKNETVECREVFEYAVGTGRLSCASCNPSGQRPLGFSNLSLLRPGAGSPSFRQPANLSPDGSGRLFFESQDALVPQDTNRSVQDVYEWEPQGVGDCGKASGCVALISSGSSENDSMFLDSSANGEDAFFITRQRLLPRDQDSQLDLYDARVGGGFAEGESTSCAGEACRGPISESPAQPSAGSQSFTGPGNPKPAKPKKKHHKKKKSKPKKGHQRAAKRGTGGGK